MALTRLRSSAVFSPDRAYRYRLTRSFPPFDKGTVCFILLNPSTADECTDDPTIRRCIRYTQDWGYTRLVVVNLFAYRATNPHELRLVSDPIGPDNRLHVLRAAAAADLVVCAWGNHGAYLNAGHITIARLRLRQIRPVAFSLTGNNQPAHPLYLRADLRPEVAL